MQSYCEEVLGRLKPQLPPPECGATVGVTSCRTGEGVSTWAANLAIAASGPDYQSLLLHANGAGTDWILPNEDLSGTSAEGGIPTRYPSLSAAATSLSETAHLTYGVHEPLPDRLASLADVYRWIWIDLPPIEVCLRHPGLLMALSSLVVIVDQSKTSQREWRQANEALQRMGVSVGGVVFNRHRELDCR